MQLQCRVVGINLISLVCLFSVIANAQDDPFAADDPIQPGETAPEVVEPEAETVEPRPAPVPLSVRGHGVRLSADGRFRGVTAAIDPDTLQLVPAPNIDVIFVQNGRVISQGRSGPDGSFVAEGLTPRAVYSVIAKSRQRPGYGLGPNNAQFGALSPNERQMYSAFSLAVFPFAPPAPAALDAARIERGPVFTSLIRQVEGGTQPLNVLTLTLIPARDLAAVGLPQTFPSDTSQPTLPGTTSSGSSGGSGGSGGGSGLAGAGAAAAGAGLAGGGGSQSNLASPFMP